MSPKEHRDRYNKYKVGMMNVWNYRYQNSPSYGHILKMMDRGEVEKRKINAILMGIMIEYNESTWEGLKDEQ